MDENLQNHLRTNRKASTMQTKQEPISQPKPQKLLRSKSHKNLYTPLSDYLLSTIDLSKNFKIKLLVPSYPTESESNHNEKLNGGSSPSNFCHKPNYLMKSLFFDNKSRTPTHHSSFNYTNYSPICRYFENSANPTFSSFANMAMKTSKFSSKRDKKQNGECDNYDYLSEEEDNEDEDSEDNIKFYHDDNSGNKPANSQTFFNSEYISDYTQSSAPSSSSLKVNSNDDSLKKFNSFGYSLYGINNGSQNISLSDIRKSSMNDIQQSQSPSTYFKFGKINNLSNINMYNQNYNTMNNLNNINQNQYPQNTFQMPINIYNQCQNRQNNYVNPRISQNYYGKNNSFHPSYKKIKKITNQNYTTLSDEELGKEAYIIAKYQSGCRYLIQKIDSCPNLASTLFFPNILEHIQDLSTDQYGVNFIKKILQYLPEQKFLQLIAIIVPVLTQIAENINGAKMLSDLIDYLTTDQLLTLFIKVITPNIRTLIMDINGCQIIHKILALEESPIIINFFKVITDNIIEITSNKKGCAFIQKCFELLKISFLRKLICSIELNLTVIITNQFGNYIIQTLISFQKIPKEYKEAIFERIIKNICFFANQKYSSNVIEKCLEVEDVKDAFTNEIKKENNFKAIVMNMYGNYVIQKAINLSKTEEERDEFFNLLGKMIPEIQGTSFGHKLLSKLLIKYPKLAMIMLNVKHE